MARKHYQALDDGMTVSGSEAEKPHDREAIAVQPRVTLFMTSGNSTPCRARPFSFFAALAELFECPGTQQWRQRSAAEFEMFGC
jgi:hypothetical protein